MFYSNLKYKNVFMMPGETTSGNGGMPAFIVPSNENESPTTETTTKKKKVNLIVAIKKLLTKLGANNFSGNNLVNIINEASDKIQGLPVPATVEDIGKAVFAGKEGYELKEIPSVPEIPIPTPEDNGKVLSVGETGDYELAKAGGGGGIEDMEIVTVTGVSTGPSTEYTADKTYTEIENLIDSGKMVYMRYITGGIHDLSISCMKRTASGQPFIATFFAGITSKTVSWKTLSISDTDTIIMTFTSITGT